MAVLFGAGRLYAKNKNFSLTFNNQIIYPKVVSGDLPIDFDLKKYKDKPYYFMI